MPPRRKKTDLERVNTRQLLGEIKRSLKKKLREAQAASKLKKGKG